MRLAIASAGLAGLALAALLSGCTTTQPSPDPTSVAPDPTPTDQPATAPTTVLDLTCDGLLGLDQVRGWTAPDVEKLQDEATPLEWPQEVAYAQQGDLYCVWGQNGDIAEQYISNQIVIRVVRPIDDFRIEEPNCSQAAPERVCRGTRDIGRLRLFIRWDQTAPSDPSQSGGEATFAEIMDTVADKIPTDDPAPLWTPPDTSFTGEALCDDPAAWASALGVPASKISSSGEFGTPLSASLGTSCIWETPDGLATAAVVAGGAWVWDDVRSPAGLLGYNAVSIAGADAAAVKCTDVSAGTTCEGRLSVRGAFVEIDFRADDPDDFATRVATLLAAI